MSSWPRVKQIIKHVSISMGLYRVVRWLDRRIRPGQLRTLQDDIRLYKSFLPPNALCFDVGANIGEKSEALLEGGARVVSFEPNPMVLPELQARCQHYKEWVLMKAALGSGGGISTLHAAEKHGQSSLDPNWAEWGAKFIATYYVPILTLDQAIQCFGRPDYCKIDVEGWELEVLRGLTQNIPLISIEFLLEERDIRKTIACLERIAEFGEGHVNITPDESSRFHFERWVPLTQFIEWFPGDLRESLGGNIYGNIYIKSDAAA